MYTSIIVVVILAFLGLLFINIYFRVKVFKYYKVLVDNRVDIEVKDLLDIEKIKNVVVPKYPHLETEILAFVTNIRRSVILAFVLLILIALCWSILYRFS
ncbi:MAG TPA: hypothetical protein PLY70_09790 [Saprospiraceae bacterium]|nr:hypothetical protein [Saprospiraceae bacterium]HPN69169.1 hypothetical protein [Saprospiraceae bacterium]